ncbi:PREDICTED: heavy metal-associated isoprenylated plant protein 41-like isoform X2 [Ipomoea nil]|uniref:heavy metal-associated isoprenylated plant protein 41-like isoform X2 n=1 Tax=Ipomoea nil TaxID=35883 RepID=UPI0009009280|nr:PREDICTED: heavy metal-associated isoprenylated plant protein 41-like isoform X2 [Ipomoea nil]
MVNEDEQLEEDDEKQNEEKGREEQKADEMVNEGEEIEEEEKDEMVNKSKELEDDEEQGEEMVNKVGGVVLGEDEKWIKQYSSSQTILLVGEGDFSFSAALATAFGDASNMVATSLDSHAFLAENYTNAVSNIAMMRRKGCKVIHGVDATDMANHPLLKGLKFDLYTKPL